MNSPSFDLVSALFPPYLAPTIDKYLRADIGRTISEHVVPVAEPRFVSIEGKVLTYGAVVGGLLISDMHSPLATLDARLNVDLLQQVELVPLSLSRFLVIGSLWVVLYDLHTGVNQLVKMRTGTALHACRLDASTFVLGDRDLQMFTYTGGGVSPTRRWPLKMNQVSVDRLIGAHSCFLAVRGNMVEVYDPFSVPGMRSVTLPFRPQSVVAGRCSVLIASEQTVFVYEYGLTPLCAIQVHQPMTAMGELADGCVVIAYANELNVWKAGQLHHTYRLGFTPCWMAVPDRELVCAQGARLYTFQKEVEKIAV